MSSRVDSTRKQGVPTSVFVVTIIVLLIVGIFAGFTFFQLNKCIGEQLNEVCPTVNTNTTD